MRLYSCKKNNLNLLISYHPNVSTREEALVLLSQQLIKVGCASENYPQAVVDRERIYPTGVKIDDRVNIALAHAYPEFVYRNGIVIGILKDPIYFYCIDDPKKKILVKIIFILAAVNRDSFSEYINQLVDQFIMKPEKVLWIAENYDFESIIDFFSQEVFND